MFLFTELVLMRIGFIESTSSFLLKIFMPFTTRNNQSGDFKLEAIVSGDVNTPPNTEVDGNTPSHCISEV